MYVAILLYDLACRSVVLEFARSLSRSAIPAMLPILQNEVPTCKVRAIIDLWDGTHIYICREERKRENNRY
jgi:hypothetical protein